MGPRLPFFDGQLTAEELRVLFERSQAGDEAARKQLEPYIFAELRRLAQHYMRRERKDHTLQVTGLINEAMTRLIGSQQLYANQTHYYATAARIMRHVLVDYAKARGSTKRGGFGLQLNEGATEEPITRGGIDLVEIDDALTKLQQHDEAAARAIELHYFGSLTIRETAEVLGVSESTVTRDIRYGRSWLRSHVQSLKSRE